MLHLFFTSLSPQSSYRGSSCVDQVADNGRARRSPDRTHDHHRGQRRQPAGPAGACKNIIPKQWKRGTMRRQPHYFTSQLGFQTTTGTVAPQSDMSTMMFCVEASTHSAWITVCRYTWQPLLKHPWWAQRKTQRPHRMTILMTTRTSSTRLALMRSPPTWLLQVCLKLRNWDLVDKKHPTNVWQYLNILWGLDCVGVIYHLHGVGEAASSFCLFFILQMFFSLSGISDEFC